ncbi:MAG: hypothetical protein KatS3mg121_0270 [Gammaproteobacteria bacterium]|nr:MAG: hypothetical protein KatS3mg121_0270 [Gammaproteobacteria bacterium]
MTLDRIRSVLWVALPGKVVQFDRQGREIGVFKPPFVLVKKMEYDAHQDRIWMVAGPVCCGSIPIPWGPMSSPNFESGSSGGGTWLPTVAEAFGVQPPPASSTWAHRVRSSSA